MQEPGPAIEVSAEMRFGDAGNVVAVAAEQREPTLSSSARGDWARLACSSSAVSRDDWPRPASLDVMLAGRRAGAAF